MSHELPKKGFVVKPRQNVVEYYTYMLDACLGFEISFSSGSFSNKNHDSLLYNTAYNTLDPHYINQLLPVNPIDLSPFEWNFDLDKSGQKFHHSLKEHHKISNIPKFRCEML